MHTAAETDTHAPANTPLDRLRGLRFMQSEDTTIATLASWTVGLVIFTLAGFYIGTVAGHDNHPEGRHPDLNPDQLISALPFAAGGLVLGLVFALLITFWYVPTKLRELDQELGHH